VPLWIGGNGPKRTLRIAARFADAWNCSGGTPDEVADLCRILDGHCADIARDPAEIRRSVQVRVPSTDDETLRLVEEYAHVGVDDIIFITMPPSALAQAEQVTALLPRLRSIG
jgi:alkanesulfonate monooxygenase SsuD/methylene tetrahydromethanopterin reductase-like flavin-dependent oxidoreductase (luciferase family)